MERINYTSIEQAAGQYFDRQNIEKNIPTGEISFEEVLNKQRSIAEILDSSRTEEMKFSKHAGNRLAERNISLTDEQMDRLLDGTKKAQSKGIKESLVILDNFAFIVNTASRTVITAMDQNYEKDNIYTNIDGAVVI